MILLTDEEIKKAVGIAEWQGINFDATKADCEHIAKAQLEKVVRWLKICGFEQETGTLPLDEGDFVLPVDAWQALLKEVE